MGIASADLAIQRLKEEVTEANQRADAATRDFETVAGYLLALYDNLQAITTLEPESTSIGNAINKVPGLSTFIHKRKRFIKQRDQQLRNEALLKMTLDQARAMGFVEEWRTVHQGLSAKDQRFQEAMGEAGFPVGHNPDDRDGIGGPAD